MNNLPCYLLLNKTGELTQRISLLSEILRECKLCPRECGVDRTKGELGYCKAGGDLMISSVFPHFGEEAPLVGINGSGTIFLTHCNLRCVFCQNADISHGGVGETTSAEQLAQYMCILQERGCHNINFVTPTHYIPQIIASLPAAIASGLSIPLVFNSGGYESPVVIKLLEGIIDIYMPDVKFNDRHVSKTYANAPDYPEVVKKVLREMHRQVGDLQINQEGIALRGLLIRHLVMPHGVAGTRALMHFIAHGISPHTYVNLMSQYRPEYRASCYPELNRLITDQEYREAIECAKREGLYRGFPDY